MSIIYLFGMWDRQHGPIVFSHVSEDLSGSQSLPFFPIAQNLHLVTLPFSAQVDKRHGPHSDIFKQCFWSSATTHSGYKMTLTHWACAVWDDACHHRDSTHMQRNPGAPRHTTSSAPTLAVSNRGRANPAPVFSAVRQLEAPKLLTS